MINDKEYFVNTLDTMGIHGVKRRYWLRLLNTRPDKVASLFFEKLDREYANQRHWEIAKVLLLKNHPHLAGDPEPTPEPEQESPPFFEPEIIEYNLEYFLRINGGRWGCAMVDIDEYEHVHGVIL
jgi:hypothetical protein